jgi:hypothetical protein
LGLSFQMKNVPRQQNVTKQPVKLLDQKTVTAVGTKHPSLLLIAQW